MFAVAISLIVISLLISKVFSAGSILYPIATPLPLLTGVLLYLYVKSIVDPDYALPKKDYMHFIWYIIHFLALIPFYFYSFDEQMVFIEALYLGDPGVLEKSTLVFRVGIRLVYVILSLRLLFNYQRDIKNNFSDIKEIQLKWLIILVFAFFLISPIVVILRVLGYHIEVLFFIGFYLSSVNYLIGFYFLKQPDIYQDLKLALSKPNKYERSGLTSEKAKILKSRLLGLMDEEEIYQETKLTAKELADKLEISPHILSELLNEHFKKNFYDFINEKRVEEAKRLILEKETENMTMLAIAFEVGFNSKSTFNSVFKKFTGMTPTKFKSSQIAA